MITRRDFLKTTSLLGAATPFLAHGAQFKPVERPANPPKGPPQLRWLEGTPAAQPGTAWGVAWPRGEHAKGTTFALKAASGESVPVQTWPTAYWPDGSLKWTGHAIAPDAPLTDHYTIEAGAPKAPAQAVSVRRRGGMLIVDTGIMRARLGRSGEDLIASLERDGRPVLEHGRLTGLRQGSTERDAAVEAFTSRIDDAVVEQDGPVRAVVKLTGQHVTEAGRAWLPFTVRLYFHAGSEAVRMAHTFIFDGNEEEDFIRGLGVRFAVPMRDELYNRHLRFGGQDRGLWGESVQGLTGLRRDPGEAVRAAQIAGEEVPPIQSWNEAVSTRVHWIPTWSDFSLSQLNANGFTLEKRTKPGHAWIPSAQGQRAPGFGYVGGVTGGMAFGMRDFWQLHPTQLDVRAAATEAAEVTLWIWSPEAGPMDIRFYHDGLDQDVEGPLPGVAVEGVETSVPDRPYAKQLDALNITYEDYEPGFGTPHGVSRTTDFYLWACEATPTRERLADLAGVLDDPPQLVARPGDYLRAGVFGTMWSLPDRSSPPLAQLEDRLDWSLDYYAKQIEQHHWYGFWDYGDFMHTYDRDRHMWRYDVGGYAWDNSELSTDIWLWMSFLRSGETLPFRLAEAMNRHTRDVDIYHLGRFAGLGTRHNVQHWGCSAKQLRISTSMNRRFHYFLTTDERTGDVLEEVIEADRQLANINPVRKLPGEPFNVEDCRIGVGTDWGSAVSNWLTAWERTGDDRYRQWIVNSMESIGAAKWGFFTGTFAFDIETKKMVAPEDPHPNASHLSTMFGLPEVCSELIQLLDVPSFTAAWIQYCTLYNAPREVLDEQLSERYRDPGFVLSHSRITAYGAEKKRDAELARRAAQEFLEREWGPEPALETERIDGPAVLNPLAEAPWVSTNDSAQWGLAAIQVSALVPEALTAHARSSS
ncbi:MAG: twin-arginine translocation signal domain-containing protein [Verrucomicrobiota bacterium]